MKIAMIIAFKNFRDEEYFIPKEVFEKAGATVTTVSTAIGTAIGVQGGEAESTETVEDLDVGQYDALVFVGGAGAHKFIENSDVHRIAQEAAKADKVLGAICIAPAILARAGVLFGKKATVWSSSMDKSAVNILKEEGALYREEPVVVDGKLVTARGPEVAKEFGETVLKVFNASTESLQ